MSLHLCSFIELLLPDAFAGGNHFLVEAVITRLIATEQQHGLAFGVEGVENTNGTATRLDAKLPKGE
jgi:hypothetical protein